MQRKFHLPAALYAFAGGAAFMALCLAFPGFAELWLRLFIRPVSRILAACSSALPFPAVEILAIILTTWFCLELLHCLLHPHRAKRFLRRLFAVLTILFCVYAAVWFPAYPGAPMETEIASIDETESLCRALIDRLNESDLHFSDFDSALETARAAISEYTAAPLPTNSIKLARYPEWMDALGICGLYSPWTGEAVIHPGVVPAARIFTAAHELMHAQGIADEGLANLHAWLACRRAGGEAAVSADLYALRMAMGRLRQHSEDRWRACTLLMRGTLIDAFSTINGFAVPEQPDDHIPSPMSNYDALVDRLATAFSD